jgi:hypothetical protein
MDWQKVKETAKSLPAPLSKLLIGVAIAIAIYGVGFSVGGDAKNYEQAMKDWQKDRKTLLTMNDQIKHDLDSTSKVNEKLEAVANKKTVEITKLTEDAKVSHNKAEVWMKLALDDSTVCNAKCSAYANAALEYKNEAQKLQQTVIKQDERDSTRLVEISNLKVGINTLKDQNTKLVIQLNTVPVYHEPKLLGIIPKPSRTVSFIAGVIVGGAAVAYIAH